jgi:hypothetical protein
MREKIAGYLEKAGGPLPAEQILREVLNILSPNSFAADKVLRTLLGDDSRFHESQGLWSLNGPARPRLTRIAVLHLQGDTSHPCRYRGAVYLPATGSCREFLRTEARASSELQSLRAARNSADDCLLLVWSVRERRRWSHLLRAGGLPAWPGESLAMDALAARALPGAPHLRRPEDAASALGLAAPDTEQPAAMARYLEVLFRGLLEIVPDRHRDNLAELQHWIAEGTLKVDFSRFAFGRDFLAGIPESPGVYLMRNRGGEVIYVGKADNLRRRVRSYFTPRSLRTAKVARIHGQLYSLEFLTCATEVEALLLEVRMIRDFRPVVNLQVEIHEQPARYGSAHNLLLLIPVGANAEVYLLKDGVFVARLSVPLGRAPSKKLCARIRTVYFGNRSGKTVRRECWETEIVSRWLSARRRHLNLVDVDESGNYASVVKRLEAYLTDPDRLSHKVYYR